MDFLASDLGKILITQGGFALFSCYLIWQLREEKAERRLWQGKALEQANAATEQANETARKLASALTEKERQ